MTIFNNIGIILLAAGSSSRMGSNKLAYALNGMTLLENAVRSAIDSRASDVVVVIGANRKENKAVLNDFDIAIAVNLSWKKGIGSSIKCGLNNLTNFNKNLQSVIISVCDQPFLTADIFNNLIDLYLSDDKKIVVSDYNKNFGVPVLYDNSLFNELLNIPDEQGAKKFVVEKAPKGSVGKIPFPKGDIDIDTVGDLKQLTSP